MAAPPMCDTCDGTPVTHELLPVSAAAKRLYRMKIYRCLKHSKEIFAEHWEIVPLMKPVDMKSFLFPEGPTDD